MPKMGHWLTTFSLFLAATNVTGAQTSPNPAGQDKGFEFYEAFEGSSNADGQVMTLDSSATYNFSPHFSAGIGLPIYFDHASSVTGGTVSSNGIGNAFVILHAGWKQHLVNYATSLMGATPTGDAKKGLSTGHATFDWDNRLDRDFSLFTPFVDIGLANSITDTRFFHRPFISYGNLAHFEGGTDVDLSHSMTLTLSAYDIAPWGTQTVTSRLVTASAAGNPGSVKHGRIFQNTHQTTGSAALARDNGYTAGLSYSPRRYLGFAAGYTRSVGFALNTVSFEIGVNLSSLFGKTTGSAK